jgi:hypothetical protein
MTKDYFLNALAATAYITLVASVLFYGTQMIPSSVDGIIVPIAFLSLFVLSAALMVYFFLYQPVRLLFEHKPAEATRLFLMTILAFACVTGVLVLVWILLSTGTTEATSFTM